MRTVLIICGLVLVLSALLNGAELLHAVETAHWGITDAVGAGGLIPLIDQVGQALLGLLASPPMWRLLLGGFVLHLSFRI